MDLPSSSRSFFLSTPTIMVLQCSAPGSLCSPVCDVLSLVLFVQITSGSPSLSPDSLGILRSPLYTFCTYLLSWHTSYTADFICVCLFNQTMCPSWAGILSYSPAPSASSTECETNTKCLWNWIKWRQRFSSKFLLRFSLTPNKWVKGIKRL